MQTESITQPTPEPPIYQCRHIFTDGHRCGSRSLRGEAFCYYHHQTRKPAAGPRLSLAPDPNSAFDLPLPEDRSAIQQGIGLILQRIALNQLDPRRAGLLLYALQIASCNLPKALKNAQPVEAVGEITLDDAHGYLAPESELHRPQGEKSLETILLEQWAKDDELAANPTPDPYPENGLLDLHAAAEPVVCPTLTTASPSLGWASAAGRPHPPKLHNHYTTGATSISPTPHLGFPPPARQNVLLRWLPRATALRPNHRSSPHRVMMEE